MTVDSSTDWRPAATHRTGQMPWRDFYLAYHESGGNLQALEVGTGSFDGRPEQNHPGLLKVVERCLNGGMSPPWARLALDAPAFTERVLRRLPAIPRGEVRTYGELAEAVGRPGAGRAVGQALRSNPYPLILPCHRVVRADGTPGGYGGVPDSPIKRQLLRWEGYRETEREGG